MTDLAALKDAARKAGFARRQVAFDMGQGHAGHLSKVLAGYPGVSVSGYMAMRSEIDPTAAMAECSARATVGVPVIIAKGAPLKFRAWTPGCVMERGTFGAQIPSAGDWITPEIVIVPLVAWDRRGGRLGYGGGFYDRTLQGLRAARPTLAIGFAFAAQEMDIVPLEPTDQPLDMIVTEHGVIDVLKD